MYLSPRLFKFLLNIYGPYLGAGVKIEYISNDWYTIRVSMKQRWYNTNAVGVHFGGSLYSMVDPHLMLMHMQLLGKDYIVWDKSASIDFVRPGKGRVYTEFSLVREDIDTAIKHTEDGKPYEPSFEIYVRNEHDKVVARIQKQLHIRKKDHSA
jgi:acyl-coenzyme A thioesterase PaaI-like protein